LETVRNNQHKTAKEIVDRLFLATRQFSPKDKRQDDLSALVIKVEAQS
jgi:hypothetical protein